MMYRFFLDQSGQVGLFGHLARGALSPERDGGERQGTRLLPVPIFHLSYQDYRFYTFGRRRGKARLREKRAL